MTNASNDVIVWGLALFERDDVNGKFLVLGTQDEIAPREFDVLDGAGIVLSDGVDIGIVLTIRSEGVVMAVDQKGGAGQHTRKHTHAFAGVNFNENETLPVSAGAMEFGAQATQESFFEF